MWPRRGREIIEKVHFFRVEAAKKSQLLSHLGTFMMYVGQRPAVPFGANFKLSMKSFDGRSCHVVQNANDNAGREVC